MIAERVWSRGEGLSGVQRVVVLKFLAHRIRVSKSAKHAIRTTDVRGMLARLSGCLDARALWTSHRIFSLDRIQAYMGGRALVVLTTILTASTMLMSAFSAAAQTVAFELNGTRFYVPKAWTISVVGSNPHYGPSTALATDVVFKVERSILIRFPNMLGQPAWQERYPEIRPPFIYELAISPGIRNLKEARQRVPGTSDPDISKRLEKLESGSDGFVRLGEQYFVAVRADDNDGAGGYLQFSCKPNLTEKDRGVFSSCSVYTYVLDGIGLRATFDGLEFDKPRWRDVPKQVDTLVNWLVTPPSHRREKIN
jgi:hypothetical protein